MNIEEALARWKVEQPRYERAGSDVVGLVRETATDLNTNAKLDCRTKDPHSWRAKVITKGYEDAWAEVTDKVGVRVTLSRASDVDLMWSAMESDGRVAVIDAEDKRVFADPDRLGYSGVHVQIQAPPEAEDTGPIECEVQLRTAAQDIWSVASHSLLYKPVVRLPPADQHAAYRLVALVELFDLEVEKVMTALSTLPGYEHAELIRTAELRFMELTEAESYRDLTVELLTALGNLIPTEEGYPSTLTAFVEREQRDLRDIYERYGPRSALAGSDSYALFSQAEGLVLLELLSHSAMRVREAWLEADLPLSWLRTLASVAGVEMGLDT